MCANGKIALTTSIQSTLVIWRFCELIYVMSEKMLKIHSIFRSLQPTLDYNLSCFKFVF